MRSFFTQSLGRIGLLLCALIFISACSISYELPDEDASIASLRINEPDQPLTQLTRFGTLYIQGGQWAGQQVIPAYWIEESLTACSQISGPEPFDGYGYMWWLDSIDQTAWADGWRGQYMIIDRNRQLVAVSRNDTGRDLVSITWVRLFGKDGFRDHHQTLHPLMAQAIDISTYGAAK